MITFHDTYIIFEDKKIQKDEFVSMLNNHVSTQLKKEFYTAIFYDNLSLALKSNILTRVRFDETRNHVQVEDEIIRIIFSGPNTFRGLMDEKDNFYLFLKHFRKSLIEYLIKTMPVVEKEISFKVFQKICEINKYTETRRTSRYNWGSFDDYYIDENSILQSALKKVMDRKYEFLLRNINIEYSQTRDFIFEIADYLGYTSSQIEKFIKAIFNGDDIGQYEQNCRKAQWSEKFIVDNIGERLRRLKDMFIAELKFDKKNKRIVLKSIHAATDLANYVFCPASYVLDRMYDSPPKDNFNTVTGNEFHQKKYLLDHLKKFTISKNASDMLGQNANNYEDYKRLYNSSVIFHSDDDKKSFYSRKRKFVSRPDYIFKDSNSNYFAVEEKFSFREIGDSPSVFDNHKMQALVYLYGIEDYQLSNVYIIYWYLSLERGEIRVVNYQLFNVTRTEGNKSYLINKFNEIEELNANNSIFATKNEMANFRKCVKCEMFRACDYKKGNNFELKII